ncbi:hypothetical protein Nepgr_005307 [Nepenthes gracilis]|uniref:Uncharacterized protein n=1 Tax=Nepenthes gracilis TaxID=150966 RepID=A0AAD3S2Y1_NEPGR|nr:hypothetical protein Nepgr_005307 [Nepenthes gracilis]
MLVKLSGVQVAGMLFAGVCDVRSAFGRIAICQSKRLLECNLPVSFPCLECARIRSVETGVHWTESLGRSDFFFFDPKPAGAAKNQRQQRNSPSHSFGRNSCGHYSYQSRQPSDSQVTKMIQNNRHPYPGHPDTSAKSISASAELLQQQKPSLPPGKQYQLPSSTTPGFCIFPASDPVTIIGTSTEAYNISIIPASIHGNHQAHAVNKQEQHAVHFTFGASGPFFSTDAPR